MEKLISAKDIGRRFGFKTRRIRYWDKIGFLTPTVKIGTRKYYTSQDLIGLRTAKGLLDAGVSLAKVRRSVIDVKKISSKVMRPLSQLLIHGDERKGVFEPETIRFKPRGQSIIGFSQKDFERGLKYTDMQFEPDFTPVLEENGTPEKTPRE